MIGLLIALVCGLSAGSAASAAAIVAGMGLWRLGIDEIKAHCDGLADRLGEPTLAKSRKRTLS